MRGKHLGAVLAGLLALGAAARADEILLVDGRKIVGQVVEESPDSVTIKVPYGTFKLKRSRIVSITKQSKFDYHIVQGDHFASRGQLEVAIGEYRKAVALKPDDRIARIKYFGAVAKQGRRYLRLKRHTDARETFKELARLDPGNLDSRAGLRRLDERLGAIRKLISDAGKLTAARRHGEAITALIEAMESAPEMRAEISSKLADAYRGAAEQLYAAGQLDSAASFFSKALSLKPGLAPEVEGRYISSVLPGVLKAVNGKDHALAARRLAPLLEFAPTDPRVLYWSGVIHASKGNFAAAARYFARGLGRSWSGGASREQMLALHEELKKGLGGKTFKLEKPFAERYVESDAGDWQKLEGERFIVYHHNEKLAKVVLQSAEYYLDRIRANMALGSAALWKDKCPIYVHRNKEEYLKASGQAEWSGGVSSVKTAGSRLVSQKVQTFQTAPKLLNSVLPHEMAHLVYMGAIKYTKKFPLVMHEGVAVYNELAFRRSYYAGVLRTHLATETTIPLAELFEMKKYPKKPDLFYAQGASIVAYLIEARGAETFYAFSLEVEKLGLAGALKKHYGFKDYAEMDEYWQNRAKGKK